MPINVDPQVIQEMINAGRSLTSIGKELGVSSGSVSYFCKKHGLRVPSRAEAMKRAFREKYGVENPGQIESVKKKIKQTNLLKYGTTSTTQLKRVKEAREKALQENKDEIVAKRKATSIERYGETHYMKVKAYAAQVKKKEIETKIQQGKIFRYKGKSAEELAKEVGLSYSHFKKLVNKYGLDFALSYIKKDTALEQLMADILSRSGLRFEKQFRVQNRIADFFLPDFGVVLEADGLYWHCDAIQPDKYYHVKKRNTYINNGYKPLFFFSDEIEGKPEIVASIIRNKCGLSDRYHARKTSVVEVNQPSLFLNDNHLMGAGRGRALGLEYRGELLSVMQVCNGEISRFCHAKGISVIGGFSKLLRAFDGAVQSTFIDLRYGNGSYLINHGFSLKSCYPSFSWTNGQIRCHRLIFSGSSGYEAGFYKVWDCGQARYVWCIS